MRAGRRGHRCHGVPISTGGMSCEKYNTRQLTGRIQIRPLWITSDRLVIIALASLGALGSVLRRPRGSARLGVGGRARRARHRGRAPAAVAGGAARAARAARRPRARRRRAPSFEFADGTVLAAEVTGVGADWVALEPAGRPGRAVVPLRPSSASGCRTPTAAQRATRRPRARRSRSA